MDLARQFGGSQRNLLHRWDWAQHRQFHRDSATSVKQDRPSLCHKISYRLRQQRLLSPSTVYWSCSYTACECRPSSSPRPSGRRGGPRPVAAAGSRSGGVESVGQRGAAAAAQGKVLARGPLPAAKPSGEYGECGETSGGGAQYALAEPHRHRTGRLEPVQFLGCDAALGADHEHQLVPLRKFHCG
jgi:hypothetical protein